MSCEEKSEITLPVATLLADGVWVGSAAIEGGENKTEEFASQNQDIRKLEIVFNKNGTVTETYNNGRPSSGTWKLINNDTAILFMENTPNEREGEILLLTENQLRIKSDAINLELHFVKKQK